MIAARLNGGIEVDGAAEAAWRSAVPLQVVLDEQAYKPSTGYQGIAKTTVELRAMYDAKYLYVLARWNDPIKHLARFPWEKQADGRWKQLKHPDSTKHENHYYEDKFSVFWNISEAGFEKKGCDRSCHMVQDGMLEGRPDSSAGRHYTRDGGLIDEWHWKATRTNVNFQADDGFVNGDFGDTKDSKWGRHADDKTGGGYYDNVGSDKSQPAWMNAHDVQKATYWVLDREKIPFQDLFQAGDRIGGIVTAPFEGNRGDVTARGVWKDGYWTLELRRALRTAPVAGPAQDLQFDDLGKTYLLGIAAFDGTQINHLYHNTSIALVFAREAP